MENNKHFISKELFISVIESIRIQCCNDRVNSEFLEGMFPGSTIARYGHDSLFKSMIELLQVWFPRDENGHCEIEHYCFALDFGRWNKEEVVTAENLWDQLTK